MVVTGGLSIVFTGMAAGLIGAWGLTRIIVSLLFGVKANDATTFAAVAGALPITVFFACLGPAVSAARLDPLAALHYEYADAARLKCRRSLRSARHHGGGTYIWK
jgi:putative ABC transport system permease protein